MNKKEHCVKKQNCDKNECCKLNKYTEELIACSMKMQVAIARKLEEAKVYEDKANRTLATAKALKCRADGLLEEAEELNEQLKPLLRKINILMCKTIECYKEDCGIWDNCEYCCGECCNCECAKEHHHDHDHDHCHECNEREFGYNVEEYAQFDTESDSRNQYWHK